MSARMIEAVLQLTDNFSAPLAKAVDNMTAATKAGNATRRSITKAGKAIASTGQTLTTAITVPVVGAMGAIMNVTSEFEASMSKVAAISGAQGEEYAALSEKAQEMGNKTKFSASEAAEAMTYMAMAGWKTDDMLSGVEGVMNLAAASGEDLSTTSDIVTDALTAFGLTAADSSHFADILAAASSNANTNVSMMGETFKYAAPIAGALGFSAEDTAEAIGLMANAGIKGSQAGTALRTIMNSLTGDIKISGAALGDVAIATTNTDGSMRELSAILSDCRNAFSQLSESEQAQTAEALVGKNAMSGFLSIMNAAPEDVGKLSTAINDCNGTAQGMADIMQNNLSGRLTELKSRLEVLAITIGETLLPVVSDGVEVLQGLVDRFSSMDETTKKNIVTFALVSATVGPVLMVFGKLVTTVAKVATVISTVNKAGSLFSVVLGGITSPAGIVVGAVAGLAAAVALLVTHWDTALEVINKIAPIKALKEQIEKLKEHMEPLIGIVSGLGSVLFDTLGDALAGTVGTAISGVITIITGLVTAINGVMDVLEGLLSFIVDVFTGNWEDCWGDIKDIFDGVFKIITGGIEGMVGMLETLGAGIGGVVEGGKSLVEGAKTKFGKAKDWVADKLPGNATGTTNWQGGITRVNEKGGEIMDLPSGTRIYPHDASRNMGAGASINIPKLADQIIVRENADIDRITDALARKIIKAQLNMGGVG